MNGKIRIIRLFFFAFLRNNRENLLPIKKNVPNLLFLVFISHRPHTDPPIYISFKLV